MSFNTEDADPASLLKDKQETNDQDYRAPLNGDAPEPSIDGTSVNGGEGGVRAANAAEVGDEEKKVRNELSPLTSLALSRSDEASNLVPRLPPKAEYGPGSWMDGREEDARILDLS